MKIIFWTTFAVIAHTWIGYLAFLKVYSLFRRNGVKKSAEFAPSVSLVLAVYNEETIVRERILNITGSDYPRDRLEVIVASDESTDSTDEVVESMGRADGRIRLLRVDKGGKSAAQNKAIEAACGDVLVLTDAGTLFEADTIRNIVSYFSDGEVGCVSGRLEMEQKDSSISRGLGFYWRYEMLLRRLESKVGLMHTASGAVMAVRADLFTPFEPIYGDDCVIPLDIAAKGFRVVHADDVVAYDAFPSTLGGELKTRIRMTLRNVTGTLSRYHLLNIFKRPLMATAITSHKILRWLTPFFMLGLLASNAFLLGESNLYAAPFAFQCAFYLLGFVGYVFDRRGVRVFVASQIYSFIVANIGFFLGVIKVVTGTKVSSYKKQV